MTVISLLTTLDLIHLLLVKGIFEMRKITLILILTFGIYGVNAQGTIDQDNFKGDKTEVYWQKAFEHELDVTSLAEVTEVRNIDNSQYVARIEDRPFPLTRFGLKRGTT
jgi:hypothetical protein